MISKVNEVISCDVLFGELDIDVAVRLFKRMGLLSLQTLRSISSSDLVRLHESGIPIGKSIIQIVGDLSNFDDIVKFIKFFEDVSDYQNMMKVFDHFRKLFVRDYCEHLVEFDMLGVKRDLIKLFVRNIINSDLGAECKISTMFFVSYCSHFDLNFRRELFHLFLRKLSCGSINNKELHLLYRLYAVERSCGYMDENSLFFLHAIVMNSSLSFSEAQKCDFYCNKRRDFHWSWLGKALLCKMHKEAKTVFQIRIVWTSIDSWFAYNWPTEAVKMKSELLSRVVKVRDPNFEESVLFLKLNRERPTICDVTIVKCFLATSPLDEVLGWVRDRDVCQEFHELANREIETRIDAGLVSLET